MASYLKSIDPNQHLVTTHFSHPDRGEPGRWSCRSGFRDEQRVFGLRRAQHFKSGNRQNRKIRLRCGSRPSTISGAETESVRHPDFFPWIYSLTRQARGWWKSRAATGWVSIERLTGVEQQFKRAARRRSSRRSVGFDWSSRWAARPATGGWLHIHFDNRYGEYKALAKFHGRRGRALRQANRCSSPCCARSKRPTNRLCWDVRSNRTGACTVGFIIRECR